MGCNSFFWNLSRYFNVSISHFPSLLDYKKKGTKKYLSKNSHVYIVNQQKQDILRFLLSNYYVKMLEFDK